MLEFYYYCIDKYLDRESYEYLEMDIDSVYMVLSGDVLEEFVKREMRVEYQREKYLWFFRDDIDEYKVFDKRISGFFKVEWKGEGFVGLNLKTYCCWG